MNSISVQAAESRKLLTTHTLRYTNLVYECTLKTAAKVLTEASKASTISKSKAFSSMKDINFHTWKRLPKISVYTDFWSLSNGLES